MDRSLQGRQSVHLPANEYYRRRNVEGDPPRPQSPPHARGEERRVRYEDEENYVVETFPQSMRATHDNYNEDPDRRGVSTAPIQSMGRPIDILPLLQRILETNNALYDVMLEATSARRRGPTYLSDVDEESLHGSTEEIYVKRPPTPPPVAGPSQSIPESFSPEVNALSEINGFEQIVSKSLLETSGLSVQSSTAQSMVPGTQQLVPYGTFLPRVAFEHYLHCNLRDSSTSPNRGIGDRTTMGTIGSAQSIAMERRGGIESEGQSIIFSNYTSALLEIEFLTEIEMSQKREERTRFINDDAPDQLLDRYEFSGPQYILHLYPARYDESPAPTDESPVPSDESPVPIDGTIDVQNLAKLCSEVRASLRRSLFRDWGTIPTFIPLLLERLLCCTGDPLLRLDACWDRRPRGTFLDFGWTRAKPDMPHNWSFFAHCSPEILLQCVIEITEAVAGVEPLLAHVYTHPWHQPWRFVTTGDILRALYTKRILEQPGPRDNTKYAKHILYVLAATELLNTFFKSKTTNLEEFQKIYLEDEEERISKVSTEALLRTPLSRISKLALCPRRTLRPSRNLVERDTHEVFDPKHLRLEMLTGLGSLKVEWTEYMHEHLTFDSSTLTVYIYWFASHVRGNAMFHFYCDLFSCEDPHEPITPAGRSYSMERGTKYQVEILRSYEWIFGGLNGRSSNMEAYYDLPLPWWLIPLDSTNRYRESAKRKKKSGSRTLLPFRGFIEWAVIKLHLKSLTSKKRRATIRTLLKDSKGQRCELPIDCLKQLDPLGRSANNEGIDDDQSSDLDEEEHLGFQTKLSYAAHPMLTERVKILVDYMEKQKPKGFIALWKDKRDSNSWYTFWAAVVFGFVALVLALASLALSAAQTWATFQGLNE